MKKFVDIIKLLDEKYNETIEIRKTETEDDIETLYLKNGNVLVFKKPTLYFGYHDELKYDLSIYYPDYKTMSDYFNRFDPLSDYLFLDYTIKPFSWDYISSREFIPWKLYTKVPHNIFKEYINVIGVCYPQNWEK
jgi:hypothetical protein